MTLAVFLSYACGAYLIGSISWSYFIVKKKKGVDLRSIGSGNLGATNAGRVLGKKWAVIIYFLDLLKGLLGAGLAALLFEDPQLNGVPLPVIGGLSVILGHVFPFYLNFKGGKGVATGSGVLLALTPWTALAALLVWYVLVKISRMVSLASVVAAACLPFLYPLVARGAFDWWREAFLIVIALFVALTHRSNIARILRGEEHKLSGKKKTA